MKNTNKGFSLIELMVVVAIIGILATIAIPNFQRFQARSRQSSAKTEMSAVFTAQKSFFAEYQTYHANWAAAGSIPEGINPADYDVTALATSNRVYASTQHAGNTEALTNSTPVALGTLGVTVDAVGIAWSGTYMPETSKCGIVATNIIVNPGGVPSVTQNQFTAKASGCPRRNTTTPAEFDSWTMTDTRVLTNTASGI